MLKSDSLVAAVFDTHIWLWAAAGDKRAESLSEFRGTAYLSAISQWEAAMLEMKGRLKLSPDIDTWMTDNLQPPISIVPLNQEISIESCRLEGFHGDPADRIIVATALVLGLPLFTSDEKILEWSRRGNRLQTVEP